MRENSCVLTQSTQHAERPIKFFDRCATVETHGVVRKQFCRMNVERACYHFNRGQTQILWIPL